MSYYLIIITVGFVMATVSANNQENGSRMDKENSTEMISSKIEILEAELRQATEQLAQEQKLLHRVRRQLNGKRRELWRILNNLSSEQKQRQNVTDKLIPYLEYKYSCRNNNSKDEAISNGQNVSLSSLLEQFNYTGIETNIYKYAQLPTRFALINSQIWIPMSDIQTIAILTKSGSKINELPFVSIKPIALKQHCGNEILLCSDKGLYLLDMEGKIQNQIQAGYMTDVDVENGSAVVFEYNNNEILIVKKVNDLWSVTNRFSPHKSYGSRETSILLVRGRIYITSQDSIKVFSLTGMYEQTFGSSGWSVPGQLHSPYLCGKDRTGAVLVCDEDDGWLQVLSNTGGWYLYKLTGVEEPIDVIIDDSNTLFILSEYWIAHSFLINKFIN